MRPPDDVLRDTFAEHRGTDQTGDADARRARSEEHQALGIEGLVEQPES